MFDYSKSKRNNLVDLVMSNIQIDVVINIWSLKFELKVRFVFMRSKCFLKNIFQKISQYYIHMYNN